MQKLIDLGFKKAATITQDGLGGIQINVTQLANAKNILYAFITRQNGAGVPLNGHIKKPTGAQDESVNLNGKYAVQWTPVFGDLQFFVLDI